MKTMPHISVLMPTFRQAAFIRRAIYSLCQQSLPDWELIIVDDGSTHPDGSIDHETPAAVQSFLADPRIRYIRLAKNHGLGYALNFALDKARAPYVAYLPSDDLYHADHLAGLLACLEQHPAAVLAYSGVRHHYNKVAPGAIDGYSLQLVQVLHRRLAGNPRWLERSELVTDDLERMYWSKLRPLGEFVATGQVTCDWVDHPQQRHKILREPVGGINLYRQVYRVEHPIRMHTSVGNAIDEVAHYRRFRERPDTPPAADGLKILLVGELAYNAERVLALEERGHQLYGLWMKDPYWYNTVGPLPFGHVQDIPHAGWQEAVRRIQPDVIYALLNWQAVPFAHHVLQENPGIPFVWHFKEGPFINLEKGTWPELVDLYRRSHGQIYSSPEMRDWFETVIPGVVSGGLPFVLDGDLPKADWFDEAGFGPRLPRLSQAGSGLHTVVPGRPIGLHPHNVAELAEQDIHLHFYGDFTHGQWKEWIDKTRKLAPDHIHLHAQVDQEGWLREFSQYDAGWLHYFHSENQGELVRANWDDLNYPARIATLAAAGLPLLQRDNRGSIVATQALAERLDIGLAFSDLSALGALLRDETRLQRLRANMWQQRQQFTFDYHADRLIAYFRTVIASARPAGRPGASRTRRQQRQKELTYESGAKRANATP